MPFSHYHPRAGDDPCVPHGCDPPPTPTSKETSPNVQFAFFGLAIILVFLAITITSWCLYRRRRNRRVIPCWASQSTSNRTRRKSVHQSGDMGIVIGLKSPISPVTPIKVDGVHSPAPQEDTKWSVIKDKLGAESDDRPEPVQIRVTPPTHMDETLSREFHSPPSPV